MVLGQVVNVGKCLLTVHMKVILIVVVWVDIIFLPIRWEPHGPTMTACLKVVIRVSLIIALSLCLCLHFLSFSCFMRLFSLNPTKCVIEVKIKYEDLRVKQCVDWKLPLLSMMK